MGKWGQIQGKSDLVRVGGEFESTLFYNHILMFTEAVISKMAAVLFRDVFLRRTESSERRCSFPVGTKKGNFKNCWLYIKFHSNFQINYELKKKGYHSL